MNETLKATVAEAKGSPLRSVRVSLRPRLEFQSKRLHDDWASACRPISVV